MCDDFCLYKNARRQEVHRNITFHFQKFMKKSYIILRKNFLRTVKLGNSKNFFWDTLLDVRFSILASIITSSHIVKNHISSLTKENSNEFLLSQAFPYIVIHCWQGTIKRFQFTWNLEIFTTFAFYFCFYKM